MPEFPYFYLRIGGTFTIKPQMLSTKFKKKLKGTAGYELHWLYFSLVFIPLPPESDE